MWTIEARADRDLKLEILDLRYRQECRAGGGLALAPSAGRMPAVQGPQLATASLRADW